MDKIDLDAIIDKVRQPHPGRWDSITVNEMAAKECMKEAIHQALVLASEQAWYSYENQEINKQSILDVEKLVI